MVHGKANCCERIQMLSVCDNSNAQVLLVTGGVYGDLLSSTEVRLSSCKPYIGKTISFHYHNAMLET